MRCRERDGSAVVMGMLDGYVCDCNPSAIRSLSEHTRLFKAVWQMVMFGSYRHETRKQHSPATPAEERL